VSLERFCEFAGKDPDEILAFCFLRKRATGERFPSVKRREELAALVRAFRDASSDVLSFLIHGGVLVHPGMV
jgi:hypothetical protein